MNYITVGKENSASIELYCKDQVNADLLAFFKA